ncbi:MAG: hypothetical protein LBK96_05815 [Prevotellaceae bacterium]|nr:hypothetical protein [Prevotellaceae bacterium]
MLLSFFYLSYVASGIFEQIRKEIKKEAGVEITEQQDSAVSVDKSFVFDYLADIPEPNRQTVFPELSIDIPVVDDGVPLRKKYLSDYFLRPPPNL